MLWISNHYRETIQLTRNCTIIFLYKRRKKKKGKPFAKLWYHSDTQIKQKREPSPCLLKISRELGNLGFHQKVRKKIPPVLTDQFFICFVLFCFLSPPKKRGERKKKDGKRKGNETYFLITISADCGMCFCYIWSKLECIVKEKLQFEMETPLCVGLCVLFVDGMSFSDRSSFESSMLRLNKYFLLLLLLRLLLLLCW